MSLHYDEVRSDVLSGESHQIGKLPLAKADGLSTTGHGGGVFGQWRWQERLLGGVTDYVLPRGKHPGAYDALTNSLSVVAALPERLSWQPKRGNFRGASCELASQGHAPISQIYAPAVKYSIEIPRKDFEVRPARTPCGPFGRTQPATAPRAPRTRAQAWSTSAPAAQARPCGNSIAPAPGTPPVSR